MTTNFDPILWFECIENTKKQLHSRYKFELEIISPFGFEVFNDKSYLTKNLTRFFIYIGVKNSELYNKIENKFAQYFIKTLSQNYPISHDKLMVVALRSGRHILLKKH